MACASLAARLAADDTFLPLSEPFALGADEDWRGLRLWLDVNDERRQACEAGTMIHSVPRLLMFISSVMRLEPGDLVLTGTPKGVARLRVGDRVTAGVEGHVEMAVDVVAAPPRAGAVPALGALPQTRPPGRISPAFFLPTRENQKEHRAHFRREGVPHFAPSAQPRRAETRARARERRFAA